MVHILYLPTKSIGVYLVLILYNIICIIIVFPGIIFPLSQPVLPSVIHPKYNYKKCMVYPFLYLINIQSFLIM